MSKGRVKDHATGVPDRAVDLLSVREHRNFNKAYRDVMKRTGWMLKPKYRITFNNQLKHEEREGVIIA